MPAILRRLAVWFALAGGAVACIVGMLTVASIAGRATMSRPIQGDVELTQFGIAFAIALFLPWAQLRGSNIIVDFFTQRARAGTIAVLDAFGSLLLAAMVALLAWRAAAGAFAVSAAHESTMILELPMWWTYAVLAPGLALAALIALLQARCRWLGLDPTGGTQ
jgi:TRAP-type C4-dicarboxylate transport system permease small subunit